MKKLIKPIAASLMLSLMLSSGPTYPLNINLETKEFRCLDREQRETIEDAFEQNEACHDTLVRERLEPRTNWQTLTIAILSGLIGGLITANQLRH